MSASRAEADMRAMRRRMGMGVEGQADLRRIRHTHAAEVGEVEVCLDLCLKLIDERALP